MSTDFQDQTAGVSPLEYFDNMTALWNRFVSKNSVGACQSQVSPPGVGSVSRQTMPERHDHLQRQPYFRSATSSITPGIHWHLVCEVRLQIFVLILCNSLAFQWACKYGSYFDLVKPTPA